VNAFLLDEHLLKRLGMGPMVDKRLQILRFNVLDSLLAGLNELLVLKCRDKSRVEVVQSISMMAEFANINLLWFLVPGNKRGSLMVVCFRCDVQVVKVGGRADVQ